jgi:outer membrane protein assembly factor BamB
LVFVTSRDQRLYALDSQTGQEVWKFETGGMLYGPAVADGVVYVGSNDLYVYAVEAQTGRELWTVEVFSKCNDAPVVGEGVVYFGSGNYLSAVGEPGQ